MKFLNDCRDWALNLLTFAILLGTSFIGRADAVVVFNEIMYNPSTNQQTLEWIELHSQMAVNVDLSGWSITGGINYTFPEGAVITGGGYLVVALAPMDLQAVAGITNVFGPYTGRLANGGDTLKLRNKNDRVMDAVSFGVDGDWPAGPDGSGVSLAKRNEDGASSLPSNWTMSAFVGGTPGARNFSSKPYETITSSLAAVSGSWKYYPSNNAPSTSWNGIGFDDSTWPSGKGLFASGRFDLLSAGEAQSLPGVFNTGIGTDGVILASGTEDLHYQLTFSAQSSPPPPDIPATVMVNHPAWLANDASSSWIGCVSVGNTDVAPGSYNYRTSFTLDGYNPATAQLKLSIAADDRVDDVKLNGISQGISFVGYSSWSGEWVITNDFIPGTNTIEFFTVNEGFNPAGFRTKISGIANSAFAYKTILSTNLTTCWFRSGFNLNNAPGNVSLQFGAYVADGVIVYLNGAEVLRLNMPAGSTTPPTNIISPAYLGPFLLPNTSLLKGTNVLAVEVHRAAGSTGLLFGADLSMTVTNILVPPPMPLAFNEISKPVEKDSWLEIINHGVTNLNLEGCVLVRQRSGSPTLEYVFPSQEVVPGALIQLSKATLGFGADPGDRFFLYTPARNSVIDALTVHNQTQARFPDGTGQWLHPSASTPGASNEFSFHDEIVINEVMYHPPTASDESADTSWLELFNRSTNSVDISGWRLAQDIDFTFAAATVIPAGGYLVVAKDVGWMQANHPGNTVAGPFSHNLKNGEGHLQLLDAAGNPANQVHYYGGAPWPEYPNGGGSSLELRDPWADNSKPEAWSASDESMNSVWTNVSYTMTASQALGPTLWKEFVMGLLDAGECLISDLHVIESPATSPVEMLQNGSFTSGLNAWRALGDHSHSRVETDSGNPVLHLIATGATEHSHNHLETTLAGGRSVVSSRQYQVSYRAKWLVGNNRLNTRLYFNRVAQTTALPMPTRHGTPGARNTAFKSNIGPTFSDFAHSPITPKSNEPVTVSLTAQDPQGMGAVTLYWSANEGPWKTSPMEKTATADLSGYTRYAGVIPAQPSGTVVQFHVQAMDAQGVLAAYPAGGAKSRALYKVVDGASSNRLHSFRLLMTASDADFLHQTTNVMSNDRLGVTVVYDDREVFYNAGIHLQSSERGRDQTARVGFSIKLPADHLLRGTVGTFTIDRSGGQSGLGGTHDEILLWHAVNHSGGIPGLYNDLVLCDAPQAQQDGTGMLRMGAFGSEYFDNQYVDGSSGNQFKMELIYYPTTTTTGNPEFPKLPEPDDVINIDLMNWGDSKESYRWIFLQENHADQDNYSQVIALNKAFSLTGTNLDVQMNQLMDVDEYMRALAFKAFTGDVDTYTYGYTHNWLLYFRPDSGKALGLLWDMDYSYCGAIDTPFPGNGSDNTYKLVMRPAFYRMYYNHLLDIMTTTVNSAYLQTWASHYGGLLGQDWSRLVTYLQRRADFIKSKMPPVTPFTITSNGGHNFATSASQVTLNGTAPLNVKSIAVNGTPYTNNWTSLTNWTMTVPLSLRINTLTFQGVDNQGLVLPNAVASITITNNGATATRFVVINEWMADNSGPGGFLNSSTNLFSDWLELYNPNATAVDLSGCYLTDSLNAPSKWQIPSNTLMGPGGFLLIWADGLTNLNANASSTALHANFKLSKSGSELGLYGTNLVPWHTLTFGPQIQNVSQGFYPDGDTNAVYSMTNWSPGLANQLRVPPSPRLSFANVAADGSITFSVGASPGRAFCVEYKNDLNDAQWTPLVTNRVDSTPFFTINNALGTLPQRFYRAVIMP